MFCLQQKLTSADPERPCNRHYIIMSSVCCCVNGTTLELCHNKHCTPCTKSFASWRMTVDSTWALKVLIRESSANNWQFSLTCTFHGAVLQQITKDCWSRQTCRPCTMGKHLEIMNDVLCASSAHFVEPVCPLPAVTDREAISAAQKNTSISSRVVLP